MARDDTGLGYLGDVNPIALANIEAQGATNGRGRSEPKAVVFGIEPVFPKEFVLHIRWDEGRVTAFDCVRHIWSLPIGCLRNDIAESGRPPRASVVAGRRAMTNYLRDRRKT